MNASVGFYETHTPRGNDKVAHYGWTTKDQPGELMMLRKTDLGVHPAYQREAVVDKIKAISAAWSWVSLGALIVGEREGKYWVIDGQHRLLAAKRRSDITHLPCVVFQTETIKDEARGFLDANTNRKPITSTAKHRAMVAAGDETAIYVKRVCDELGLEIREWAKSPGTIKCVSLLIRRATENREAFREVLALAAELSQTESMPVAERLIDGLWVLNLRCGEGLRDKRLVNRIRERGAKALLDAAMAAAAYYKRGGAKVWASGMLTEINKGLRFRFEMEDSE